MASKDIIDQLKDLTLQPVIPQNKELGHGAYGKVFAVDYLGLSCAAKEIHPLLLYGVSELKIRKRSKMVSYENVITPV